MKKTVFLLMIITVVSKILGFLRDVFLSYFYGATSISDVFLISIMIPTVIFALIGNAISTGFIPMFTRIENKGGDSAANIFTGQVTNGVLLIGSIVIAIGLLFTEPIVKIFASGFHGETLETAVIFTRISLISIYFHGMIFILSAYLQVKNIFLIPNLIGIPANIAIIVFVYVSSVYHVYLLAIGAVLSVFLQFLLLIIFAIKHGFRFQRGLKLRNGYLQKLLIITFPAAIGAGIAQVNLMIDRTMASWISEGGISALNYADTLNLFAAGIITTSIIAVLFPKISNLAATGEMADLKDVLTRGIQMILLCIFPATVAYMVFSQEFVSLLYGRGQFDSIAIALTSSSLFYYSIGMTGYCLHVMISNVFFALQDTKTPMYNGLLTLVLNVLLNFALAPFLGIGGLAFATSISSIIGVLFLGYKLKKRIGDFGLRTIFVFSVKTGMISLLMIGVAKGLYEVLYKNFNLFLSLALSALVGSILYAGLLRLFKIFDVKGLVVDVLKGKVRQEENQAS